MTQPIRLRSRYLKILIVLLLGFQACKSIQPEGRAEGNLPNIEGTDLKIRKLHEIFVDATKEKILGNYDNASRLYHHCLEIDPKNAAVYYELAQINYNQFKMGEALNYAQKSATLDPGNTWYSILYAQLLQSYHKYDQAIDIYERLVKQEPGNSEFWINLASLYLNTGNYNDALKAYDKVEQLEGPSEEFLLMKHKIYLETGKPDKAVEVIEELIQNDPKNLRYYSLLSETYMDEGNKEKAFETLQRAESVNPGDPYLQLSYYDYYQNNGDKENAFSSLKKAFSNPALDKDTKAQILLSFISEGELDRETKDACYSLLDILRKTSPGEAVVNSIYGDFLYLDNRLEEARQAFRDVISKDSSRYAVWEQLLRINAELQDDASLIREGKRAIDLFPEQPVLFFFTGVGLYDKKEYEQAIRYLNQGSKLVVDDEVLMASFYSTLGDSYNQIKDYQASDNAYEKSLRHNPDNAYVLNNYSYYLSLRSVNLEKAEIMAKKANVLSENNANYLDTYAWVLYKLKRYAEAENEIKKALELDGNKNPVILEHYGDILFQKGDKENAMLYWQKAKDAGKGSDLLEKKINEKTLIE